MHACMHTGDAYMYMYRLELNTHAASCLRMQLCSRMASSVTRL